MVRVVLGPTFGRSTSHLATAQQFAAEVARMVACDERMAATVRAIGSAVAAPDLSLAGYQWDKRPHERGSDLTAKLTAKRNKKCRSRGYRADDSELPAVQKRTVEHPGNPVSAAWQARGPGFESPMLHLFPLNSELAVNVNDCQFLA